MPPPPDTDQILRLLELVTQAMKDRDDTNELFASFRRHDLKPEEMVNELTARYHLKIGGAVKALAVLDKNAAQQLGERIRKQLDESLSGLDPGPSPQPSKARPASSPDSFRDREDSTLRREYLIMKLLTDRADAVRSTTIFAAVKTYDQKIKDEAITTHLARLVNAHVVGRERKGRYNSVERSSTHLAALGHELVGRGLTLPAVPTNLPD